MAKTVSQVFDAAADGYDVARRKLIPCFDAFYGAAVECVLEKSVPGMRILDLGAGTGLFTSFVTSALPDATLTLTDASGEMLRRAQTRFSGDDKRIECRVMDHLALNEVGAYDIIMSALSIHHLENADKQTLFSLCHRALRSGGRFINADQVAGDDEAMEEHYWRNWHQKVVASGLSSEEIAAAIERQTLDRRAPLLPQLQWLRCAGFSPVECRYKNVSFVVLCCDKRVKSESRKPS